MDSSDLPIVDGHLDLAESVTLFGRDLTLSAPQIRAAERRTAQQATVSLPDLERGGIAVGCATVTAGFLAADVGEGFEPRSASRFRLLRIAGGRTGRDNPCYIFTDGDYIVLLRHNRSACGGGVWTCSELCGREGLQSPIDGSHPDGKVALISHHDETNPGTVIQIDPCLNLDLDMAKRIKP